MKSFIALAFVIGLVNVQGSSLSVLDNDHGLDNEANRARSMLTDNLRLTGDSSSLSNKDDDLSTVDDRDAIITDKIRDELQNIETMEDALRLFPDKKQSFECIDYTCKLCFIGFCIAVGFKPDIYELKLVVDYMGSILYKESISSQGFSYCEAINLRFYKPKFCLEVSKARITSAHACLDLSFSFIAFSRKYKDLCM